MPERTRRDHADAVARVADRERKDGGGELRAAAWI
jgi:hypothetical protein